MKEATGTLSMGIVTLSAIGVMAAFFYFTLWPSVKENYNINTQCSKASCGKEVTSDGYYKTCVYVDDDGTEYNPQCIYKG